MGIVGFYIRKFWMIVKNEVLVLPSRIIVFLFCLLLLLLPVFTQDPYLLRILILTSILPVGIFCPVLPDR
jgi:branched-chain amino acid transport system permease protein